MKTFWTICIAVIAISLAPLSFSMEWQLLASMRQAAQELDYRGDFMHRRGDSTNVYSITHRFELGTPSELLRQLDGDMIEVLREGDKVICYYPQGSEQAMSNALPAAPYTQVNELDLTQISDNYKAQLVGTEVVAGLQAKVILLVSDDWRYSHKLWLESKTNLLLQSEIIGSDSQVLEQFRFTRIEIGADIRESELVPSLANTDVRQQLAYKTASLVPVDDNFKSTLGWVPEGFKMSHSSMKLDKDGWKEQRTFTDGLVAFSVFVERLDQRDVKQSALAKMGATTALMRFYNHYSVTIVGEVPGSTAKKVAEQLIVSEASI